MTRRSAKIREGVRSVRSGLVFGSVRGDTRSAGQFIRSDETATRGRNALRYRNARHRDDSNASDHHCVSDDLRSGTMSPVPLPESTVGDDSEALLLKNHEGRT